METNIATEEFSSKFATDRQISYGKWLYGGTGKNNYFAAKGSNQELLSANFTSSFHPLLGAPLSTIIDFDGHRLFATAYIKLSEDSPVYGSPDAGRTVFSAQNTIADLMRDLGNTLNLKEHYVGNVKMALCGDIEVHEGPLGLYFLLDTARVFPPEYPANKHTMNRVFSEKLRPEFLKTIKEPLNSDGLTGWNSNHEDNKNIDIASELLRTEAIKNYVKYLLNPDIIEKMLSTSLYYNTQPHKNYIPPNPLLESIHEHGINARHLGLIYKFIEQESSDLKVSDDVRNKINIYILNIMICRALKNLVRDELRSIDYEHIQKQKIAGYMNLLTSNSPSSQNFLRDKIPALLKDKYDIHVSDISQNCHQGFLLIYFCQLMGINLAPNCYEEIRIITAKKRTLNFMKMISP